MLDYVTESLFDSPAQTLVNTVNTDGVMGKGIALEFKKRFPDMFERYRTFCKSGDLTIGKLWIWRTPNKWVLNFPTKKHWRNPSKAEYVEEGLKKFVDCYMQQGITSVSFPQLGCGNGGLSWEKVVRPMMDAYLKKVKIPVYIHQMPRRLGFRPEHVEANSFAPRNSVGFLTFLNDLRALVGMPLVSGNELVFAVGDIDCTMPGLDISAGGKIAHVAGEDLRDLWNVLRARGAVATDRFPGSARAAATPLVPLLVQLGYIRPIEFANPGGAKQGIKLAASADLAGEAPLQYAEGL